MSDEGFARHIDQRFRNGFGKRAGAASPDHRRVLRPGSIADLGLRNELRAFEVEAEPHLAKAGPAHAVAQSRLVLGIEHQEPPAARANQLSAQRSVFSRQLIITRRSGRYSCRQFASSCAPNATCMISAKPRRSPASSAALLS